MMYPSIAELMKRADSRYSLVIAVAKRARELAQGAEPLVNCSSDKEVTEAVYELYYDKLKIVPADGPKKEDCSEVEQTAEE